MSAEKHHHDQHNLFFEEKASSNVFWQIEIQPADGSSLLSIRFSESVKKWYYTPDDLDKLIARLVAIKEVITRAQECLSKQV